MNADGVSLLRHEFAERRRELCDRIVGSRPPLETAATVDARRARTPTPGEDGWRDRDPGSRPRVFRARITVAVP